MGGIAIVTDSMARFTRPGFPADPSQFVASLRIVSDGQFVDETPETDLHQIAGFRPDLPAGPVAIPPSIEAFTQIYSRLQKEADHILSIHASARLSATALHARAASQQFLGRCDIQVIDSQSISVGQGLLVQAAADSVARGETAEETVRIVRGMIPRLYMVFFLERLDYLERLGRISRSQALLGSMLGIIPFLSLEEGEVVPIEKVRSRPRAVEKLIEFVSEFSRIDHLSILQCGPWPTEESRLIAERLQGVHPDAPISINCYGASVATCIGPESMGVVVLEAAEEAV
ncbi:MAG TPA: DegV family protein [Anaerolineales bacterium]|nr:DegV family protein [Anaerolineales bacterium]